MLSIFVVTGLIGNVLVLVVYSKKFRLNPTKVLIMTIASFDLIANVGAIPSEINIMFDSWNFKSPSVCKSKVFLGSFTTVGGAISLLVVAVVRYRKVCRPYDWQVSIRQAIIASIVTAIISFLFAIPYIIIYGVTTRKTPCPNIKGHECFADDAFFYTVWPLVNNILFVLLYLSLSVSMVVLYVLIGVTAWKHSRMFVVAHGAVRCAREHKRNVKSCEAAKASPVFRTRPVDSTDTERIVSPEKFSRVRSAKELFTNVRTNALLCCKNLQTNEKNEEDTKSSSQKTCSTTAATDSDAINKSLETINSESSLPCNSSPMYANAVPANNTFHCLDHTPEMTSESSDQYNTSEGVIRFDKNEGLGNEVRVTLNYQLVQPVSNDEEGKDTQKHEKDILKFKQNQLNTESSNCKSKPVANAKKEERRRPLGRMTAMLIIISAIFVLGFLPFLSLTIFKNRLPETYASLSMVELTFYNLFYRLYFLNSAANPIIYSLCDINFRRECIRLLTCQSRKRFI
ncbi:unnamed protein product [Candidula unifasciata]|uniref:G-protein coupled receptors family 1 profile domain-containing protein n=1 Tax=Candidula unifasciata TaxID=100452 RepID=A0A8S3ZX55_9EUPU|nr:unnamed protein product [Candidula unifasciata]